MKKLEKILIGSGVGLVLTEVYLLYRQKEKKEYKGEQELFPYEKISG